MNPYQLRLIPVAVALALALLILGSAFLAWQSGGANGAVAFAWFAAPLLLPLSGMLHNRTKAFVVAALLALLYLFHALVTLSGGPQDIVFGWAETVLSLALLVTAALHARWLARQNA